MLATHRSFWKNHRFLPVANFFCSRSFVACTCAQEREPVGPFTGAVRRCAGSPGNVSALCDPGQARSTAALHIASISMPLTMMIAQVV